ncbi:hypothetical protein M3J09_012113 [Ascochyta lentis]
MREQATHASFDLNISQVSFANNNKVVLLHAYADNLGKDNQRNNIICTVGAVDGGADATQFRIAGRLTSPCYSRLANDTRTDKPEVAGLSERQTPESLGSALLSLSVG